MKIITYNVNGLRAAVTKGFPEWLAQEQPDVLCLQETKLPAEKKGYSGVAILAKREPVSPMLKDARILNAAVHSDHCPMVLEITE